MADDNASDDSDEWGTAELELPAPKVVEEKDNDDDDEAFWEEATTATKDTQPTEKTEKTNGDKAKKMEESLPMILVDMTQFTKDAIHSRFDRNSVNDPSAVSTLRKTLEKDYEKIAKDPALLEDGTVIPCSSSVWKEALSRLRDERPGHYFSPIFPPKSK